jgi:hypothetical protein
MLLPDLDSQCARIGDELASAIETKLAELNGRYSDLVPVESVRQMEAEMVALIRDKMDGLAQWLEPRVLSAKASTVDKIMRQIEAGFMRIIERGRSGYPPIELN